MAVSRKGPGPSEYKESATREAMRHSKHGRLVDPPPGAQVFVLSEKGLKALKKALGR
jgi:hypothetical protein